MFSNLIESRRSRPRTGNWTTISIAFHFALITTVLLSRAIPAKQMNLPGGQDVNLVVLPALRLPSRLNGVPQVHPKDAAAKAPAIAKPVIKQITKLAVSPYSMSIPMVSSPAITTPLAMTHRVLDPSGKDEELDNAGDGKGDAVYQAGGGVSAAALFSDLPLPVYPLDGKIEGVVRMRYIVDTLGWVEPGSIHVVSTSHPLLSEAAQNWLAHVAHFKPAQFMNGKKVRQLSMQDFTFKINQR